MLSLLEALVDRPVARNHVLASIVRPPACHGSTPNSPAKWARRVAGYELEKMRPLTLDVVLPGERAAVRVDECCIVMRDKNEPTILESRRRGRGVVSAGAASFLRPDRGAARWHVRGKTVQNWVSGYAGCTC